MSAQNPRPPRRRIAGERRPTRLSTSGPAPDEVTTQAGHDESAPHVDAEEVRPALPPDGPGPVRPDDVEPARSRRDGPSGLVVAAVGGLALLLMAAALVLGLGTWSYPEVRRQDRVDEAARAAPATAERASATILSYDYKSLGADEKAAARYLTPGYKKQYTATFDRLVRPHAAQVRAKVEARVKASGVVHADADRVNVLLFVNQTTTSTANGGQPQVALNRVQLSMVRRGSSWLVDDITSY
jgi:Mce-associated membrane protein